LSDGSAELVDADEVARGIAEGAVANPVRLLGRLLADPDPAHPAVSDVVADLEAEGVAIEGQGGVRVVMREEAQ